jgi:SAM-dependent methyltransferase
LNPAPVDCIRYGRQLLDGTHARLQRAASEQRQRDVAPYLQPEGVQRVLDLANGRLRPQYTLLKALGFRVCGVDLANRTQRTWSEAAWSVARWVYARTLGATLKAAGVGALVRGNAALLPFRDGTFDLVTCVAAFEHFLDVPGVVAEVARVLRPGGVVWASIHLFASLSGAHNFNVGIVPLRSVPRNVQPWDHLRQRRLPLHVPLNGWCRDQYLEAFACHLKVVKHYCRSREGEHLLTPAIEGELSAYARDELTCRTYVIVALKSL